jgi:hypothetical protein
MHIICLVTLIINIYGLGWESRSHFFKQISQWGGASPPLPNIKFLSFVVSEKCVILKICTFSIKKPKILQEKNNRLI